MRQGVIVIFCSILLISCGNQEETAFFYGNWIEPNSKGTVALSFLNDSLISNEYGNRFMAKWYIRNNQLNVLPNNHTSNDLDSVIKFHYDFNASKDTLFLNKISDSTNQLLLVKVENRFEYLEKKISLEIELPKLDARALSLDTMSRRFDIYLGFQGHKLTLKTSHSLTDKYIVEEIETELARATTNQDVHVYIVADKRVPQTTIDSVVGLIKNVEVRKVSRVYWNSADPYENTNWNEKLKWYGKSLK